MYSNFGFAIPGVGEDFQSDSVKCASGQYCPYGIHTLSGGESGLWCPPGYYCETSNEILWDLTRFPD
jgi:hypothetical protein